MYGAWRKDCGGSDLLSPLCWIFYGVYASLLEYTSPLFEISVQLLTKKKNKGSDPRLTADE
jgi:hypothetical protein